MSAKELKLLAWLRGLGQGEQDKELDSLYRVLAIILDEKGKVNDPPLGSPRLCQKCPFRHCG